MNFKRGDKVRCINDEGCFSIVKNQFYIIYQIRHYATTDRIILNESGVEYYTHRFILEEPINKPQTELEWLKWFSGERHV